MRPATVALLPLWLTALAGPSPAEMMVAARTIPARTILAAADIALRPGSAAGAAETPTDLVGREARVALYAGRPIRLADVGAPAVIERNQIVTLVYMRGGLHILTEGRALGRAGAGERVRVMNLASRTTVSGEAGEDGRVHVPQQE